ncbi:hypothetical protein A2917_03210 [Candidatus Nomurabacteria bacterium RIFCSPLOWO2_01_FULL_42_17]|uniref:HTH cro/C1-type domain-containing protein n=1 Tax=Candidatus Nomurabacteria bacterium RIFCSPLOWO2_01_FULL_42_17 TaxID=1801780 RepID=A0A1F6XN70_9BACT|nr:MAG: hypothetical protein A2917_03210 [Candidatus Nomurabacteria bacterium RIFCSPLOWO2_01_FULL_42_17]
MDTTQISDEALFELMFSERANKLFEQKIPDLEKRLTEEKSRRIIIQNIKILMLVRGIETIKNLAEIISIDRAQMSKYLDGKTIPIEKFFIIARVIGVSPLILATLDLEQVIKNALKEQVS